MSSIDLTGLKIRSAEVRPLRFGGVQTPALGGPLLRVNRLGSRWTWAFVTRSMPVEPDGRLWSALLFQALDQGALIPISQPGFNVRGPGSPVVSADTAAGRSVPLSGLTPNYAIRAGQWLSIVHDSQCYLDQNTAQVLADGSGDATVVLKNLIRTPLSAGDVVELGRPMIEGEIVGDFSVPLDPNRLVAFSFTITEAE